MVLTLLLLPILGSLGDRISSTVIIPVAFGLRAMSGFCFISIENPGSLFSIFISCLLCVSSVLAVVSIEVLFMRGMPREIRGTMMGLYAVFGHLGGLSFSFLGGQLFDRISPAAPFVFIAMCDTSLMVLFLGIVACGKLKSQQSS